MKRLLSGWSVSTSRCIDLTVAQLRDENPDMSVSFHPSHSVARLFYLARSLVFSLSRIHT